MARAIGVQNARVFVSLAAPGSETIRQRNRSLGSRKCGSNVGHSSIALHFDGPVLAGGVRAEGRRKQDREGADCEHDGAHSTSENTSGRTARSIWSPWMGPLARGYPRCHPMPENAVARRLRRLWKRPGPTLGALRPNRRDQGCKTVGDTTGSSHTGPRAYRTYRDHPRGRPCRDPT